MNMEVIRLHFGAFELLNISFLEARTLSNGVFVPREGPAATITAGCILIIVSAVQRPDSFPLDPTNNIAEGNSNISFFYSVDEF